MDGPAPNIQSQERLIDDLRQVIDNAEELLKNTDQYHTLQYQGARGKLAQALQAATEELARFEDAQLSRMMDHTEAENARHRDQGGEQKLLRAFRQ